MTLTDLTATEVSSLLERREVSAPEVMTAALDRIEAVNGPVNAVVSLRDREDLMAAARAADAAPRKGWLHGIPIAVKDLANAAGLPTSMGSPIFRDFRTRTDQHIRRPFNPAGLAFSWWKRQLMRHAFNGYDSPRNKGDRVRLLR